MTSPSAPAASQLNGAQSPRRPTGGLTFRGPEDDRETPWTTLDPTPGEETGPRDPLAGSPSAADELSDPSEDDESDPRSSSSSDSDPASVKPLTQRAQRAAARQAVKIAGSMAHQYMARDEAARAVGLYLVDDETAEQIGDPLSRIAARHAGPAGAIANPDVADGIAAMLGVAKFVSITIEKSSQAAAIRMQTAPAPDAVNV